MSGIRDDFETRYAVDFGESRSVAFDGRRLSGRAIVFNTLSKDLGGFRERIYPEAATRTLQSGADVMALVDHKIENVIGRRGAGTLRLSADSRGVNFEIDPVPNTSVGRDLLENIGLGNITGMSFAFRIAPGGLDIQYEQGGLVRHITDMFFREVSVVSMPAYPDTSVAMRSIAEFEVEHQKHSAAWWIRWHQQQLAR